MSETTYQSNVDESQIEQPWGTLVGMFVACLITLWCVAHDHSASEILTRSLVGGVVTAAIIRSCTYSWTVFFPKE